MSKANAKAFLRKLMESKELVARCQLADEAERLQIAAALGYPHTARDMQAVIEEGMTRAKRRLGELSEKELDHVSAGHEMVKIIVIPVPVLEILSPHPASAGPVEIDL
jgi:hypothetical protein